MDRVDKVPFEDDRRVAGIIEGDYRLVPETVTDTVDLTNCHIEICSLEVGGEFEGEPDGAETESQNKELVGELSNRHRFQFYSVSFSSSSSKEYGLYLYFL